MQRDRLLIVDDDEDIRELLSHSLETEGFETQVSSNPADMRATLATYTPDLIIMDLMMPGEDGISATRTLRASSSIPVIMLTAKGEDLDRIIGLEMGADDYVSKPFNVRELVARIRAVLRRHRHQSDPQVTRQNLLKFEDWKIDLVKRELWSPVGEYVELTSGEFDLLKALLLESGTVMSREALLEKTKSRQLHAFDRSVDIQISRLRNKIEKDPKNPTLIKTIRSGGYMLTAQVEQV